MRPEVILPETVACQDGVGDVIKLEPEANPWLLTLNISRILEQESLEVTVSGSSDRDHWMPLVKFPRKFYCGTYGLLVNPAANPGLRYLRAEWKLCRWGQATSNVLCAFSLLAKPATALHAGAAS